MTASRRLRSVFGRLRTTPAHPQWHTFRSEARTRAEVARHARGLTLDVGCADGRARAWLPAQCRYVGLDYAATVTAIYGTRPDVFGDGRELPFANASVETVLLLDVLEHIPEPHRVLAEIARVLVPGGTLLLSVPFLYPVHDAPYDFQRFTAHGLADACTRTGIDVLELVPQTSAPAAAGLLVNLVLANAIVGWLDRRSPWLVLGVALAPLVPIVNVIAWLFERIAPTPAFATVSHFVRGQRRSP